MKQTRLFTILGVLSLLALTGGTETTSGILYNRNGQYHEAIKILTKALDDNPKDWEAHFQIGYSYSQLDSVELAYSHFMTAKELNPKKARDIDNNVQSNYAKHYKLGQGAFTRQDYTTAAHEFGMASLADPTQSASHFNRAVAFSRIAETDSTYAPQTLAEADRALELTDPTDPNYPKALALVGRQLVALDRVDEAPARFERLIAETPASFPVLEEIGNDALNRRQWHGAAVFLKMTSEARAAAGEESFDVYYNTGVANYNLGREAAQDSAAADAANGYLDEAIAFYQKALTLREDDPQTVLNIVAVTVVKKDWAEASLWCEKYVTVSPEDPRGWQFLARIYNELGDKEKALDATQRYEQLRNQTTE